MSGAAAAREAARAALGADGALARALPGFRVRAAQLAMAEAVAEALASEGTLVVEAGTGTGKTFAYLVPALLSGRKVVLSTGTRNLQDQLHRDDLPRVREALGAGVRVALLKGRANYLCLHRLERARGEAATVKRVGVLERVARWAAGTRTGDIAACPGVAEDDPVWSRVTSTAESCLGAECAHFDACFVMRARRAAQEADLVVVNHHLLLADVALRRAGHGELLPEADAYVLDEAHQLPSVATRFFGTVVTARQLQELARDVRQEQLAEAPEMPALRAEADALEQALRRLRLALEALPERGPWPPARQGAAAREAAAGVGTALGALGAALEAVAERGPGLAACARRTLAHGAAWGSLTAEEGGEGEAAEEEGGGEAAAVRWYERVGAGFSFHATPLDVAPVMRAWRAERRRAWVFTSATLAVGERFDHFLERMGLAEEETRTLRLESPFDYAANALLYLPPGMPDPNRPDYTDAVVRAALPVLEASRGRAFLLFTSHRALRLAARALEGRVPWPLLVQGDAPRAQLLERFRAAGDAVLLGTASFWEGVDVRGPALACVIIDRLPFAAPDDPVLQARAARLAEAGESAFLRILLPEAVLALKQGAGRLIRDEADRGVLVVCDPRLEGRGYGRAFLESLPPMPRTRDLGAVQRFFAAERAAAGAGDEP